MNRVTLDKDESRWLARNLIKTKTILESAATKDPAILERVTYRTINGLQAQAAEINSALEQLGDEPFEIDLSLQQKQKKVLKDLIDKTIKSLDEVILPEYKRRGLEDYSADTVRKISLLKKMGKKFK